MVPCKLIEWVSGVPVKNAKGSDSASLARVPSKGEMISFACKAWEVREVWHVHNGETRLVVTECARSKGGVDRPEIASLSAK